MSRPVFRQACSIFGRKAVSGNGSYLKRSAANYFSGIGVESPGPALTGETRKHDVHPFLAPLPLVLLILFLLRTLPPSVALLAQVRSVLLRTWHSGAGELLRPPRGAPAAAGYPGRSGGFLGPRGAADRDLAGRSRGAAGSSLAFLCII